MKKPMTVDELADLIISTMASKEDLSLLKGDMTMRFGQMDKRFGEIDGRLDDLRLDVQKIDNKILRVENYKVTQLELIKLLREKKVITPEESHRLLTV